MNGSTSSANLPYLELDYQLEDHTVKEILARPRRWDFMVDIADLAVSVRGYQEFSWALVWHRTGGSWQLWHTDLPKNWPCAALTLASDPAFWGINCVITGHGELEWGDPLRAVDRDLSTSPYDREVYYASQALHRVATPGGSTWLVNTGLPHRARGWDRLVISLRPRRTDLEGTWQEVYDRFRT